MNDEPVNSPDRMDHHVKMRLRRAAFQVTKLGLGPIGEIAAREFLAYEEFGYRLAGDAVISRALAWVEAAVLGDQEAVS